MARFAWPWSRRDQFSSLGSIADAQTFADWLGIEGASDQESVTPYTVLGISAVLRSVSVISTTIAGLPLRTYERDGDEKTRIPSVFDDPYPGIDGMVPFAWTETVLIHLLLWRQAFLWHDARDTRTGYVTSYRPIIPDAIEKVEKVDGLYQFTYTDGKTREKRTVGSESLTYIPGPSLDGFSGHPLLAGARAIFSGAISGDKAAQTTLRRGIRLAGLLVPEEGEEVDDTEGAAILEQLRRKVVGREHAGDVAIINRRMKLTPWTPNNIESQWAETRQAVLGEVGRLFGVPAHLLNDTEKQTSWGTGVAEQNLGLARYTLRGWSDRLEQTLSRRLPAGQFCEFDYAGLLQGTPAQEIGLLIDQVNAGILTLDEARRIRNLPPLPKAPAEPPGEEPEEGFAAQTDALARLIAARGPDPAPVITVHTPDVTVPVTFERGAVEVSSPVTVQPGLAPDVVVHAPVTVTTPEVTVTPTPIEVHTDVAPPAVTVEAPSVTVNVPEQRATRKRVVREQGVITEIIEEPTDG